MVKMKAPQVYMLINTTFQFNYNLFSPAKNPTVYLKRITGWFNTNLATTLPDFSDKRHSETSNKINRLALAAT